MFLERPKLSADHFVLMGINKCEAYSDWLRASIHPPALPTRVSGAFWSCDTSESKALVVVEPVNTGIARPSECILGTFLNNSPLVCEKIGYFPGDRARNPVLPVRPAPQATSNHDHS